MPMRKVCWTEEMVEALIDMRAKGVPLLRCAEKIGVHYGAALWRARKLGIAHRMNSGRRPGTAPAPERYDVLTDAVVLEMRRLHASGVAYRKLASRFNVAYTTARNAVLIIRPFLAGETSKSSGRPPQRPERRPEPQSKDLVELYE